METIIDAEQFGLLIETLEAQSVLLEAVIARSQMVANVVSFCAGMIVVIVLGLGFGGGR